MTYTNQFVVRQGLQEMTPGPGAGIRGGNLFSLSSTYMCMAKANCFTFDIQLIWRARSFALARAGKRSPARMAMMAITTNNSIKVKAEGRGLALLITSGRVVQVKSWQANLTATGARPTPRND